MADDFDGGTAVETAPPAAATPEPVQQTAPPAEPPSEFDDAERDTAGRWRKRGRSYKDMATPADVPVIQELTKANREGRERLEQLAKTGSPRVQKLAKEQIAIQDQLSQAEQPQSKGPEPVYTLPAPPKAIQGDPEPTIEQFADKDDPYGAWLRATVKWELKQEQLQAESGKQQQQFQQTAKQAESYWAGVYQSHAQRLTELVKKNPGAAAVLQSVKIQPPPLLDRTIMLDANSADVALFLASHPDRLDELTLLTASQPVNQQNVEIIRRRLQQMMTAGTTGAVASSPQPIKVPRPPTPVRTGPMKSGETPPSDEESLEDHASRYGHLRLDKRHRRMG